MDVTLTGSSPAAATAGILLLTRARQLGFRLTVGICGDADDVIQIHGPAIVYAPVLAGCGVGRELGSGATVVVPGPPHERLMVTVHPHGESGWFFVDRSGRGAHPATRAFVELSRDPRPGARELMRDIRSAMSALGLSTDPAVLDVLFGADVPPLTRIAVGMRAGRAMSGGRGQPVTRFVTGQATGDPLPPVFQPELAQRLMTDEGVSWILDGLSTAVRDDAERCLNIARQLSRGSAGEREERALVLLYHLAELASQLVQLPPHCILPPLGAAEDSVATGLQGALAAHGDGDANRQLMQTFEFLGGRFVGPNDHAFQVSSAPPPQERVERWQWFCGQVRRGRKDADQIWPNIFDPPS